MLHGQVGHGQGVGEAYAPASAGMEVPSADQLQALFTQVHSPPSSVSVWAAGGTEPCRDVAVPYVRGFTIGGMGSSISTCRLQYLPSCKKWV